MHTRIDLLLSGYSEAELRICANKISRELEHLEGIGNYFDSQSELSILNRTAHNTPLAVSADLFQMISLCKRLHTQTEKCFDISIHSKPHGIGTLNSVVLDKMNSSILFDRKGIQLDLSGFIKGFALDKIKEILLKKNVENALINLGNSSILALGNHPHGEGWKIATAIPNVKDKSATLYNECFTTSGNETEKRKHIIVPKTGKYLEGLNAVSVVTQSGYEGEALSIALLIASEEQRQKILKRFEVRILD